MLQKKDLYDLLDKESFELFPLFLYEYDNEIIKSKDKMLLYDGRCGHYWDTTYNRLKTQGVHCPYCSNKKVWIGFNDIATTDPWLVKLMKNKDDAYRYTSHSNKKIDWICPVCKTEIKNKIINDVWTRGLSCVHCSDGRSYPERLFANLLNELNVNFKPQFIIDGYSYIYDFYLQDHNCIVETHGKQHYEECGFGMSHGGITRSLEEEQENDRKKEELAKSLGFTYIVLNCKYSNYNYIKKSILSTNLCSILNANIQSMDFKKIHIKSVQSSYLKVCELYNNGVDIKDIEHYIHLSHNTVTKYLRDGAKNGLCDYNEFDKVQKLLDRRHEQQKKPVRCITTGKVFDSIKRGAIFYNTHPNQLSRHLNYPDRHCFAGYDKETGEKLIWEFV